MTPPSGFSDAKKMTLLTKLQMFNSEGQSFNNPIIGGNPTGLLVTNMSRYKKDIFRLYQYGVSIHWIPEKVDLSNDKKDYLCLLPEDKYGYDHILSFLIFLDSIQTIHPMQLAMFLTAPEFNLLLAIQTFQEAIHSQSYSFITETVMTEEQRERVYDLWRHNPVLKKRNKYIAGTYQNFIDNPTTENFCKAILANYILEGIYFYNGFKFFYNLAERGQMNGSSDIIKLINRDEVYHILIYELFIDVLKSEGHWVLTKEDEEAFFEEAVMQEIEFSVGALEECLGFSRPIIEEYTYYLANKRLTAIGNTDNKWKNYTKNPRRKYDSIIEADGEVESDENVFTGGSTAYVKADSLEGWDDLE